MSSVPLTRRKVTAWTWTTRDSFTLGRIPSANTIPAPAKLSLKYRTRPRHRTGGRSRPRRFRSVFRAGAAPDLLPDSLLCPTRKAEGVAVAAAAATILRRQRRQRLNRRRSERNILQRRH